jgi:hypothetical protein
MSILFKLRDSVPIPNSVEDIEQYSIVFNADKCIEILDEFGDYDVDDISVDWLDRKKQLFNAHLKSLYYGVLPLVFISRAEMMLMKTFDKAVDLFLFQSPYVHANNSTDIAYGLLRSGSISALARFFSCTKTLLC